MPLTRFFCCFLLVLSYVSSHAIAQSTRVDKYVVTTFQGTWDPLDGNNATMMAYAGGPNWGNYRIALPFEFPFDGTVVAQGTMISVGANGAISFNNDSIPDRQVVGDAAFPMLIGPFNGDLRMGSDVQANLADTVGFVQISGSAPSRVMTIEYPEFHLRGAGGGGGGQATELTGMQVKLYESTGVIEFIYRDNGMDMPTNRPTVRMAIGLNGSSTPAFVSNVYAKDTKIIPLTDLRFTPGTASVADSHEELADIYPNPATDFLNVKLKTNEQVETITAFDLNGVAYPLEYSAGRIDLRSLGSGNYVLAIESSQGSRRARISVVR